MTEIQRMKVGRNWKIMPATKAAATIAKKLKFTELSSPIMPTAAFDQTVTNDVNPASM
ncbi:MAG: hypothetical protein VW935_14855 [Novosphingobium sp.]